MKTLELVGKLLEIVKTSGNVDVKYVDIQTDCYVDLEFVELRAEEFTDLEEIFVGMC